MVFNKNFAIDQILQKNRHTHPEIHYIFIISLTLGRSIILKGIY